MTTTDERPPRDGQDSLSWPWTVWYLAVGLVAVMVSNPLYLVIVCSAAWLALIVHADSRQILSAWVRILAFLGLAIVAISSLCTIVGLPESGLLASSGTSGRSRVPYVLVGAQGWLCLLLYSGWANTVSIGDALGPWAIRLTPTARYLLVPCLGLANAAERLAEETDRGAAQHKAGSSACGRVARLVSESYTTAKRGTQAMGETAQSGAPNPSASPEQRQLFTAELIASFTALITALLARRYASSPPIVLALLVAGGGGIIHLVHIVVIKPFALDRKRAPTPSYDRAIALSGLVPLLIMLLARFLAPQLLAHAPAEPSLAPSFSVWLGITLSGLALGPLIAFYIHQERGLSA